jgi:hypothetical protein
MSRTSLLLKVGWSNWLAWFLLACAIVFPVGSLLLLATGCGTSNENPAGFHWLQMATGLAFVLLGFLIIHYRPENRIGWLCNLIGFTFAIQSFLDVYVSCGLDGRALPEMSYMAWLSYLTPIVSASSLFILLPQLFPDGRFLSPRWRAVCWISVSIIGLLALVTAFLPGPLLYNGFDVIIPLNNPLGLEVIPGTWGPALNSLIKVAIIGAAIMAIASLVTRWRRSTGDTRQQLKWFAYFLVTAVFVQLVVFEMGGAFIFPEIRSSGWYLAILTVVLLGFPITIGIAVFKYRLYDIDIIIRKTLVYAVLTILLATIYFGFVVLLQSLFAAVSGEQSAVAIVISTLIIAALFTPLRNRLQWFIDRRFYRRKYDAQKTLATFAATGRDEVDLDNLVTELIRVVQETMQPEEVSLWLRPVANLGSRGIWAANQIRPEDGESTS